MFFSFRLVHRTGAACTAMGFSGTDAKSLVIAQADSMLRCFDTCSLLLFIEEALLIITIPSERSSDCGHES